MNALFTASIRPQTWAELEIFSAMVLEFLIPALRRLFRQRTYGMPIWGTNGLAAQRSKV